MKIEIILKMCTINQIYVSVLDDENCLILDLSLKMKCPHLFEFEMIGKI